MTNESRLSSFLTAAAMVAVLLLGGPAVSGAADQRSKPQRPVRISIEPVQKGLVAGSVRSGDVVELRVIATAHTDADEVRIETEVLDGAELVSGAPAWRGKTAKGEPRVVTIGVRAPAGGTGTVKATVRVFRGGKEIMKRETRYVIGGESEGPGRLPAGAVIKKDAKGREIVEY